MKKLSLNLTKQELAKIIVYDLLGSFMVGVSVVLFAVNANFAPAGVTGLAVILNFLFKLPIGWMTILINIPVILFTYKRLGLKFFIMSAKSVLIGSLMIDYLLPLFPAYEGNRILASVFAGIFAGIGYSMIFNEDSCTGGTDFIIAAIKRAKPQMSFGMLTLIIDGSIMTLSVFVYKDIWSLVCGLLCTVVTSIALDLTTKFICRFFPAWKSQANL